MRRIFPLFLLLSAAPASADEWGSFGAPESLNCASCEDKPVPEWADPRDLHLFDPPVERRRWPSVPEVTIGADGKVTTASAWGFDQQVTSCALDAVSALVLTAPGAVRAVTLTFRAPE